LEQKALAVANTPWTVA